MLTFAILAEESGFSHLGFHFILVLVDLLLVEVFISNVHQMKFARRKKKDFICAVFTECRQKMHKLTNLSPFSVDIMTRNRNVG